MNRDVSIPFKCFIDAGSSKFQIPIPQSWAQNNGFYFEECFLVPDYYSKQAAFYKLDPQVELLETLSFDVSLKAEYTNAKEFYKDPFNERKVDMTTGEFIKKVNYNVEQFKPAIAKQIPFFIDWLMNDGNVSDLDIIKERSMIFFGEEFNESKHGNALPSSVKRFTNVNNVVFPTHLDTDTLEFIRIRIWIAPLTRITFSNKIILKQLGFHESQLTQKSNQFIILNNTDEWQSLEAILKPEEKVSAPSGFRITISPVFSLFSTKSYTFNIKREDYLINQNLATKFNTFLKNVGNVANINLGIAYDLANKMFKLQLSSDNNLYCSVMLDSQLSQRLGYGITDFLDATMTSESVSDKPDLTEVGIKTKALVLDTGMCVVTLNDESSTNLFGTNEYIMAFLRPDPQGIMTMNACFDPHLVKLKSHIAGPNMTLNVQFNLLRIFEDQSLKNFEWAVGAYIYGLLKGRPLPQL